ncbi:hypothetical protein NQ314_020043 [Rhamnusium bicolor]|uniref:Centromere/kinetochore protein zw10 homolog n=1 Tax=Rhamnusium bicolor TaxID=1586634 RepID=A0AAV8WLX1_9CUCU|nr:hypothetical protein NQ314_020043 [Rhamnusium bicolor]
MNFLAEVLSSAEKVELDEINKKVPELKLTIENFKSEVVRYIENVYVKYSGRPKQNRLLLTRAREIEDEINTLKKNAEYATKKELLTSSLELEKHIASLESIKFALHTWCLICVPGDEYLDIIDELKITIDTKKNMLLNELKNVFTDNIVLIENEGQQSVTVKIKKENSDLEQALLALYYKNAVVYPLHSFAKTMWNNIFIPIVDYIVKIDIGEDDKYYVMKINTVDATKKSGYLKVFSDLKTVLGFLNEYFNFKVNEELTALGYIGIDIRDNLSELIIKHCLQDTIPSTAEELQKYKVVIQDTQLLENILKNCKIFTEDTISIFDYANNVDILFINKKCHEYLVTSQTIMKKDLHDMVEVGSPYNPDNSLECKVDEFLQCSVSKSAIELLQFTEKVIQQAVAASDVCAGRLFCTVQNIFRKYSNFVPEYHKKLLQTIPQQVALFHNNCFYISYKLNKWNQMYSSKLSPVLNTENCGFGDEIFQLQKVASEIFTNYVEGQIKQVNEIMKEAGLHGATLEELEPITEKCIRQGLRQQELLRTVWHKVLSYPIYNKTLGVILNSMCMNIVNSVVKFEDISSNTAEQLVEVIKIILNRGPKLFTDPKEISLYVSSWYKLNELNFVLGASLLDINDRWADGKGPLAIQFKPSELKQLIRALFQNTDRRAALLSKIQE